MPQSPIDPSAGEGASDGEGVAPPGPAAGAGHSSGPEGRRSALLGIARTAGREILEVYAAGADAAGATLKDDRSPLTEADRRAHRVIEAALHALGTDLPVISEEGSEEWKDGELPREFWIVDPLDGTKEFLKRTGEFTVNIARVREGRPVEGIVYAPVLGVAWIGDPDGAVRVPDEGPPTSLGVRGVDPDGRLSVVASRDHAGPVVRALLEALPGADTLSMGSSLKFCLIAEGRADLYLRDGPTMEWDTSAAHAVLLAAGGGIFTLDGAPLLCGKPGLRNPHFMAVGDPSLDWRELLPPSPS